MKISYEFYPPKDMNFKKVVDEYGRLSIFGPRFISITYGALGSSQKNSLGLIKAFAESHTIDIVAHLTLVGKTKNQLDLIIDEFQELGVTKIVALRGDVAEGNFLAHKEGYANTSEFVESLINSGMEVIVSAYPEPHPESSGFNFDLNLLKSKTLAGAKQCISQFCFSSHEYQRLITAIKNHNIDSELTAGIMPIYNIVSLCNMAKRCGTHIPSEIINQFSDNVQKNEEVSIKICIKQIEDLQSMGVNSFHFYTLNQSELLQKILSRINLS